MQVESAGPLTMARVERAHASLNAAYNALATDRVEATLPRDAALARGYVDDARRELLPGAGHDGHDAAMSASKSVLPRLERAMQLLDQLAVAHDPAHVTPLLDELGIAMDHVEAALASVGWD